MMTLDRSYAIASGALLLIGMLAGVWKWRAMRQAENAKAPLYVDILHRAALLYAAATVVLGSLAQVSSFPHSLNALAFWSAYVFFVLTLAAYAAHAWRGTSRTMFSQRTFITGAGMYVLIAVELGGTLVLLIGAALPR